MDATTSTQTQDETRQIPIDELHPSPINKRRNFRKLEELAASFRAQGVLQNLVVRPSAKGFEIVAGERRWRAAPLAGLKALPCKVRDLTDADVLEIVLVENTQREDLELVEQADAFAELVNVCKLSVEQIVERTGLSKATVHARLKLAQLAPAGRKALSAGKIDASTGLAIARLPQSVQPRAVEALELETKRYEEGERLSHRESLRVIRETCFRPLDRAPWGLEEPAIVVDAPACKACPKNTRNMGKDDRAPGSADVCTDAECYGRKLEALYKIRTHHAEARGGGALSAKESKRVLDLTHGYLRTSDYARISDLRKPPADDEPIYVVKLEERGQLVELVKIERSSSSGEPVDYKAREAKRQAKSDAKEKARTARFASLVPAVAKSDTVPAWFWEHVYGVCQWSLPKALRPKSTKAAGAGGMRVAALLAYLARYGDVSKELLAAAERDYGPPAPATIAPVQTSARKASSSSTTKKPAKASSSSTTKKPARTRKPASSSKKKPARKAASKGGR